MPLSDNENRILQMEAEKQEIFQYMEDPLIPSAVYGRFCQKVFVEYKRHRGEYPVAGRDDRADRLR